MSDENWRVNFDYNNEVARRAEVQQGFLNEQRLRLYALYTTSGVVFAGGAIVVSISAVANGLLATADAAAIIWIFALAAILFVIAPGLGALGILVAEHAQDDQSKKWISRTANTILVLSWFVSTAAGGVSIYATIAALGYANTQAG